MSSSKKSNKDILQAPRGMRDFFGDAFIHKQEFFQYAETIAEQRGFTGIETPIMEHTEIFLKGIGDGTDIVDKEMYSLETIGGDQLTLRPEGTAPIIRSYIEHGMGSLPQPQLFHYSGPFFRHDKPQKGRYRQFYQFGLEVMGSRDPLYDVHVIETGYTIVKQSGQNIVVKLNSLGSYKVRQQYVKKLVEFYTEHKQELAERDQSRIQTNPLRILDSKEETTVAINQQAPRLIDYLDEDSQKHFNQVQMLLEKIDIPYVIEPFLVRGMDYYEHTVFEYVIQDNDGNESFALGGGGRYDGLAEMIGHTKSVPSVGLGLGVDRIIETTHNNAFRMEEKKDVPLIITDDSLYAEALGVIKKTTTVNTQRIFLYPLFGKLSKQLSRIEKEGYQTVIILGEDEFKKNMVTLRDLKTQTQEDVRVEDLQTYLS
ncbi:histidine--tRNA ligase [Patescibacteria group bacterium]|nr:histidine--tRNA ligase [Patescibacteria group bacterium]